MMVSQFLSDANSSLNRVSKYQNQVDSTKRVSNISDDPQATITALKARNKLSDLAAYQENIKTATSYMAEAETAASELNGILQTVYQEIVSAKGGSKTQDDLDVIAKELISLKEEIVSIGNTTVGTSYIFGGYNFAGTTDGSKLTPPFSIHETSGHLIYNGIDLSQVSWAEDCKQNLSLMDPYATSIADSAAALSLTGSDEYARDTLCADALSALKNLITCGKSALQAAEKFGMDPSGAPYQNLSNLLNGVGEPGEAGYIAGLSDLYDGLYNECSKELAQNLEDDSNAFDLATARSILDSVNELIGNTDPAAGFDYTMDQAAAALQNEMDANPAYAASAAALAKEEASQAVLHIGTTQTVAFTFAGTNLLGSGSDNVYYIVDNCVSMLQAGDTAGLSGMLAELQAAQSRALCFQTEIGATENRLSLISSRYTASELNYTEMQSNAVDADMAESIMNLKMAQMVYNATLAGGSIIADVSL
jgi:flagellin-like hook-associated protein FlgL